MADESGLTEIVRRAAQANAKLYKGWMDLSLEYMRSLSEIFGGAAAVAQSTRPTEEMDAGPSTLVLEGEAGTSASASFLVSNDLDRPISCKLTSSDFTDPTGATAKARTTFDPPALELAAGDQQVVKVTVAIGEALVAGVGYAGEIAIAGMDGFAVPIVLRRQHTLEEAASATVDDVGNYEAPSGTSTTPKASNAASTTGAAAPASKSRKAAAGAKRSGKAPARKTEKRR